MKFYSLKKVVLWISSGLKADPDPESQTNADQCGSGSGQTLPSQKFEFYHGKIISHKTYLCRYKSPLERLDIRFIS